MTRLDGRHSECPIPIEREPWINRHAELADNPRGRHQTLPVLMAGYLGWRLYVEGMWGDPPRELIAATRSQAIQ